MKLQHYLISFQIPGGYMHGYVMAENKAVAHTAAMHMMDSAEKQGIKIHLPIILETHLNKNWQLVRSVISEKFKETPEPWKEARGFHMTAWFMQEDDPDSKRLMELH
jgi:hypothetical protein